MDVDILITTRSRAELRKTNSPSFYPFLQADLSLLQYILLTTASLPTHNLSGSTTRSNVDHR